MIAECLLDTNILVYAVDSASVNSEKNATALELIEKADFGLSTQIMQEFYVTVTRKFKKPLSSETAALFLEHLNAFPIIPIDYKIVTEGIRNSIEHHISYWDGAVLAAAERLKARILYSEDLNHGQLYGTIEVINPFC